jgi:hypothetical protein
MPSLPSEIKAAAHVVVGMVAALAVYLFLL